MSTLDLVTRIVLGALLVVAIICMMRYGGPPGPRGPAGPPGPQGMPGRDGRDAR